MEAIINERKKFLRKMSTFSVVMEKVIQNSLERVVYEYTNSRPLNENFFIHKSQLYTAFEACRYLLSKRSESVAKLYEQQKMINDLQLFVKNKRDEKNSFIKPHNGADKETHGNQKENMKSLFQHLIDNPNEYFTEMINNYNLLLETSRNYYDLFELLKKKRKKIEKLLQNKKQFGHKGVIFQVETGEGKTCIIALIAAVLALNGKTVHVASSNIKLSNRDYVDSFDFFKKLKIKSAVFLHDDELPVFSKETTNKQDIASMYSSGCDISKDDSNITNDDANANNNNANSNASNTKNDNRNYNNNNNVNNNDNNDKNDNSNYNNNNNVNNNDNNDKNDNNNYNNNNNVNNNNNNDNDNGNNNNNNNNDNNDNINNNNSNANNKSNSTNSEKSSNEEDANIGTSELNFYSESMAKLYKIFAREEENDYSSYYPKEMYGPSMFKNSSGMNIGVCGLDLNNTVPENPPKVIFSTFVNFECFYLKMMEISPGYVDKYYSDCVLLVDEADSILIDEIANGTIISREMKTNSKDILEFIYDQRMAKKEASETWDKIKDNPKCSDLTLKDIERMYDEIDLVQKSEFEHGKKYLIRTNKVQSEDKKKKFLKQALNVTKDILIKVGKGFIKEVFTDNKEEEDEEDDENEDDDEDDEDEEEDDDDEPVTEFREIVPYDYEHKGISEPNKEFGGFIQQFIAIKESKKPENKNMIIKDMSISYLYISHPIFVKLYSNVCGFTGTIGTYDDRKIIRDNYDLIPVKIPRNKANYRVEFPMIFCETLEKRNETIAREVVDFHKRGNPVIVIFQDLKEIQSAWKTLCEHGVKGINIFDGTNTFVKPDKIAGKYGAVSLGTNVCGRGTDIKVGKKPLHVIISYYTTNKRVMDQARGRTGRQGRQGTCRVICLREQYFNTVSIDDCGTEAILEEFAAKNKMQSEFIQYYMSTRPWIFSNTICKQQFTIEQIEELRAARINVNRIVAYNYEFPLKMTVETFIHIQIQKIFSLLNCPNCEFTWRLFQRYIRELLLQSWSVKLTRFDEEFFDRSENVKYKKEREELFNKRASLSSYEYGRKVKELNEKFSENIIEYRGELRVQPLNLIKQLSEYLPLDALHVVPTFMHIFKKIVDKYQPKIFRLFGNIPRCFYQNNQYGFASIQIGFKPYSLLTESGARVNYKNYHKTNYIKDPELKYLKRTPKNKICWMSITEKIDDLFNSIFQEINKMLGKKTFLKLFMRRTLFGCEFGICLDFPFQNDGIIEGDDGNPDIHMLVDKDPLLIFTISVKSIIPILAGILIIVLVYAASMSGKISEWLVAFPEKMTKEVLKRGAAVVFNMVAGELIGFALDKIIKFLSKTLDKQIEKLEKSNIKSCELKANIIKGILCMINSKLGEQVHEKFSDFLSDKIKVTLKWQEMLKNSFDMKKLVKISLLLLLCIATFIMNFSYREDSIEQAKEDSELYEESFKVTENGRNVDRRDESKVTAAINNLKNKNKKLDEDGEMKDDVTEFDLEKKKELEEHMRDNFDEKKYEMSMFNPLEHVKRVTDYIDDKLDDIENISNGIAIIKSVVKKGRPDVKMQKMRYYGIKNFFMQQMRIYATNKLPSILEVVGYRIGRNKQDIYFNTKPRGSLESYLMNAGNKKIGRTQRLIIAYGVARAMELLHSHNVVHRNLKPSVILLDENFRPYVSEFYYARQKDAEHKYALAETTVEFMAPEFIADYKSNQDSFKIDVYAFGVTLLWMLKRRSPYGGASAERIRSDALKGERPKISEKIDESWRDLISRCWMQDPEERPTFREIRELLESPVFVNERVKVKLFTKYQSLFKEGE